VLTYKEEGSEAEPVETAVPDAHETAYIDNLLPQKSYEYSITAGGVKVGGGKFRVTGNLRMIYAPSANNIRDLGGWATGDGRSTAYGHLFRGSALNGFVDATAEDLETLRKLGVGAEIDLRWKEDYDKDQGCGVSAFGFETGTTYYFAQANDYLASDLDKVETQQRLREEFLFILNNFREGRAVYFHCAWGADRTGMLAFLLEGLLGVTTDAIYKDYELTSFSPAGNRLKSALQERLDVIKALPGAKLRDRFEYYFLNKLGVTKEDLNYFREVMLVGDDPTGIETVQSSMANGQCSMADGKYLIGNRLVIVRGGRRYTVGGQLR
jgi:protein tyrosine/serine phosphatase